VTVKINTELQNNTTFSDFCIQEVIPPNNPVLLNLSAVFNVICCHCEGYIALLTDDWMGMELCWNDIDRGNPNSLEKNLS